ncbi:hypothetical protein PAXRUDRAFT_31016 [Paxillus rubicundulus Ve08.2h10]|uniref:NTF2 domain-containing protein n=1 Tax=Paxillus rubicundulus Ve08.2h10 TaxID=930991 RepID=A0A0D0E8P3_9AGAM|nr:hypothetical protein PAXRUDRAFT_31016 [Paxillus rubicundulus Ve08.2h10]
MDPTIPIPQPGKRVRPTDQVDGTSPSSPQPNGSRVLVKRERSSPPTGRRLVTSGVKRFFPLPRDCLPSCPQYKQNRQEWASRCIKELEALNLKAERKLIRDDGLIIDWTSHVSVWSDTLRPETLDLAATITLAHQTNAQRSRPRARRDSPSKPQPITATSTLLPTPITVDTPSTKRKVPVPPRLSSMRRAAASQLVPSSSSSAGLTEPGASSPQKSSKGALPCHRDRMTSLPVLPMTTPLKSDSAAQDNAQEYKLSPASNILPVAHPTNIPNEVRSQSMVQCESSAAEEEMSEMTENYLRQYIQTYEVDRASLASAYSRNASFAYRVHEIVHAPGEGMPTIQPTSQKAFTSGPKRTRLEITMTLLTLPPLHSMDCSSPVLAQINYDIFYPGAEIGMFVICHGMLRDKTFVHNFILQRKESDAEEAAVEGIWPLVATAHQILVFQS